MPLLAAIGSAALLTDYLEGVFSKEFETALLELYVRQKQTFIGTPLIAPLENKDMNSTGVRAAGV